MQLISDTESEQLVIGTLLAGSVNAASWVGQIAKSCFVDVRIATTFQAICDVVERGDEVNILSVHEQLRLCYADPVSPALLADWMSFNCSGNMRHAVQVLVQFRVRRELMQMAEVIQYRASSLDQPVDDLLAYVQNTIDTLDVKTSRQCLTLKQVASNVEKRMRDNLDPSLRHYGPVTGIHAIDQISPLPESGLVVLAGTTSSGKSSFANRIAIESARIGMKVAVFSKEMPNEDTLSRMVAIGTQKVSPMAIMNTPLSTMAFQSASESLQRLRQYFGESIIFDDSRSLQLTDVTSAIRRLHKEHGIRVAIVDYLQLLAYDANRNRNTTQEQLMGYYSRVLKNLGDQLGVTVVALSQLNRNMPQGRPTNASLRDSGQIAEASDYIIILWRPERYNGQYDGCYAQCDTSNTVMAIVDKNRKGPTTEALMGWNGTTTAFIDLSPKQVEDLKLGRKLKATSAVVEGALF